MADRYKEDAVAIGEIGYNGILNTPSSAWTSGNIATLETNLSDAVNGIVAKVIFAVDDYVKVKWFYQGKPLAIYKSRDFVEAEALAYLEGEVKENYDVWSTLGVSTVDSLDATIADNTLTVAQASQMTVNAIEAGKSDVNVTALCTYSSSNPAKATVSAAGLVTGVAAGTSTITATYHGVTDTVVVTVS